MSRIPVSIITGSLGSGKTTLLNYLLTENHGIKIGVIVNEFGDVGIDADLIVASKDDVIELANGCVCCTVRGDLIEAVKKTLEKDIEYLLIETSGMAEPGPVANTFLVPELPEIRAKTKLDGIITVVDAENLSLALAHGPTVKEQILAADVVLLNKEDLVSEEEVKRIEGKIHEISPRTFIFRTRFGRAPLNVLLATGRFDIDRWMEEGRASDHHHEHAAGFTAVALTQKKPLSIDATGAMLRSIPVDIFRAKGILCIGNISDADPAKDLRMVFQKVGKRIETFFDRPWQEGELHESKVVLIGPKINHAHWQSEMDKCVLHRA